MILYLFDSHRKDENGNLSSFGTAVLLKFHTLYSLENYVKLVYCNTFPLTLYFHVQFVKVHCTATAKNAIKSELKKERLLERQEKDLLAKKRKYHDNTEKKKQVFKKRYHDKSEFNKTVSQREISDESNIRN